MKTTFFKRLMMPLAVMIFGIAGAFVTTSMSSTKTLAQVQGYRFVSQAEPCEADVKCSTISGAICTSSGGAQLKGKAAPNAPCDITLYKLN